jgi:hypothetical protein
MSESVALQRSYRRLLAAYPRSYRRAREIEMLTTLMDAAPPDRERPTVRESLDLIGGGVRYRLRVPRGPAYRAVAVLVAMLGALAVSAGAALAAWELSTTVPSTSEADRVARAAVAGAPPPAVLTATEQLHLDALGKGTSPGDEGYTGPAPAPLAVVYEYPRAAAGPWPADPSAALDQARARLTSEGWTVDDKHVNESFGVFWAHDGDLAVQVMALVGDQKPNEGGSYSAGDPVSVWLSVHQVAPAGVTIVAATGVVAGAVLGWLLAAWILRAFVRHTGRGRVVMSLVGLATLLVAAAGLLVPALARIVGLAAIDGWSPHDSLVSAATLWSARPVATAVAIGVLVVTLLALAAPVKADRVPPVTTLPRAAVWAVGFGLTVFVLLGSVALAGLVAL